MKKKITRKVKSSKATSLSLLLLSKKTKKKITTQATKVAKLVSTLALLEEGGVEKIPQKMKPHILIGQYKGCWECHIEPDFLLIWKQNDEKRIIVLDRLGSHSELFK